MTRTTEGISSKSAFNCGLPFMKEVSKFRDENEDYEINVRAQETSAIFSANAGYLPGYIWAVLSGSTLSSLEISVRNTYGELSENNRNG